jgi:adenosylcobinamide amidohydrolase
MTVPTGELCSAGGCPVLVWRGEPPWRCISSAPLGGGLGERAWVINTTVPANYHRTDPDAHLAEIARAMRLTGPGAGLMTALDVRQVVRVADSGVVAWVTTGIGGLPTWAAARDAALDHQVGTINAVCWLPVRLSDAALVNAVATVAEAKAQALFEVGVPGTGTPTDATVVLCPTSGPAQPFGGPRSPQGAALARAVHRAVQAGLASEIT